LCYYRFSYYVSLAFYVASPDFSLFFSVLAKRLSGFVSSRTVSVYSINQSINQSNSQKPANGNEEIVGIYVARAVLIDACLSFGDPPQFLQGLKLQFWAKFSTNGGLLFHNW